MDGLGVVVGRVVDALASGGYVVFFAGGGFCGEAYGLAGFREPGGWAGARGEDVWSVLGDAVGRALAARPSQAHLLLERLVSEGLVARVITTCIDGLLSRLMGDRVVELYGSVVRWRCPRCGARVVLGSAPGGAPRCPRCGELLVVEVVPPGGVVDRRVLGEAVYEALTADVMVVVGVSGRGLVEKLLVLAAARRGVEVYEVNPSATPLSRVARGRAPVTAGVFMEELYRALCSRGLIGGC